MKIRIASYLIVVCSYTSFPSLATTNVDSVRKHSWSENAGWINWRDANGTLDGVRLRDSYLAGFAWGENIGWINFGNEPVDGNHYANLDGSDFGVNVDPSSGLLFGLAWAENVGWINFGIETPGAGQAQFDPCTGSFFGHAWGENVGWINLDDDEKFIAVGPCLYGDRHCDGDVDSDDYRFFHKSFLDQENACPALDQNGDGVIDLHDFASFQNSFTG